MYPLAHCKQLVIAKVIQHFNAVGTRRASRRIGSCAGYVIAMAITVFIGQIAAKQAELQRCAATYAQRDSEIFPLLVSHSFHLMCHLFFSIFKPSCFWKILKDIQIKKYNALRISNCQQAWQIACQQNYWLASNTSSTLPGI